MKVKDIVLERAQVLVQALRDPGLWPDVTDPVELIETHISWVLLAGERVFKIKKPVQLGFLDFSTLPLREHYCREELRLNRRYSPELYLDVVPIAGTVQRPVPGGSGEPIEFAVAMHRFPESRLLARMAAAGQLENTHIDSLAEQVARLHQSLAGADASQPRGLPERIAQQARDNFSFLRPLPGDSSERAQIARLEAWTDAEYSAREADFVERRQSGFIRECHGDLHLGNVVWLNDQATFFDGIEFSESLRWIDVLSETAFVAMDLANQASPRLAHRFLNAYLERTGDYAGMTVYRFYFVYRALVRAKVTAIELSQSEDAARALELRRRLASYVQLALATIDRTPPTLFITHGFSGSGKTTGSQHLVESQGAIRLRSDVERKRLHGLDALSRTEAAVGADLYSPEATRRTYERLAQLATALLRAGENVIVDATFLRHADRLRFRQLAEAEEAPFRILDFPGNVATLRARLARREASGSDASDAGTEVLDAQLQSAEPLTADERAVTVVLTSGDAP